MSCNTTAARPYAKAVYEFAADKGDFESWADALANLAAITNDSKIGRMLDDPAISKTAKGELLTNILGDNLTDKQQNLVKLMAENGRLTLMPEVAELYEIARSKAENKIEAEVVSAFELSAEQITELTNTLKNKLGCDDITITSSVDETLIGGVIIKAGDTIIDASMKSQLDSLALSLGR